MAMLSRGGGGELIQDFFHPQESVTLVVDDREIEAPAAALMTASDVFKAMITSDFLERKTRRVAMPGKSYDAVQFMVQYVTSTDHVPIPGDIYLLVNASNTVGWWHFGRLGWLWPLFVF